MKSYSLKKEPSFGETGNAENSMLGVCSGNWAGWWRVQAQENSVCQRPCGSRLGTRVAWRASFVLGSSNCWEQQDSPHTSPKELPLFIIKI